MGESLLNAPASARGAQGAAFGRRAGVLYCEGIPASALASAVGTPAYVYSTADIRRQYARLSGALAGVRHRVHYSVKANANLAVLSLLRELGAGVDIVSGGELFRCRQAGFEGRDVVFSGVGKTARELHEALDAGVRLINVESEAELDELNTVAYVRDTRAPVALRINPEVTVETPHPYTRTGEKGMKFGIPYDEALAVARRALAMPNIRLAGLDMHIGSQISRLEPYRLGIEKLLELLAAVRAAGAAELTTLDIGGGLAVTYEDEAPADVDAFGRMVAERLGPTELELLVEPGRLLVGNAGVLLTTVLYRKRSGGKEFVITDAGMNDLLRPSHYEAFHRIEAAVPRGRRRVVDVVGPVCESGDFLALDREMDDVAEGDVLAVFSAGAYGFVMASNYNSRPRPVEIMVDGDQYRVVRDRERYEDLIRHEQPGGDWRSV